MPQSIVFLLFVSFFVRTDCMFVPNAEVNRINPSANIALDINRIFTKLAATESTESVYYHKIVESLIKFLKDQQNTGLEADFTPNQVLELLSIFQRVIKTKSSLMRWSLRKLDNLRASNRAVPTDELKQANGQMKCLAEFSECVNLEVIAKRLSSAEVTENVDALEYLLPYTGEYGKLLDTCSGGGGQFP